MVIVDSFNVDVFIQQGSEAITMNGRTEPMEAIILAAGYSSRANAFKMSLPLGQKTVLEHTVSKFEGICQKVIIVGGFKVEIIQAAVTDMIEKSAYSFELKYVFNESFDQGMFSSIQTGCREVNADSFFITPGDVPLVKKETIQLLAAEKGNVVIPSYSYKGGHPIKVTKEMKNRILEAKVECNLRAILHPHEKTYLNVEDPGVVMDVDTPEDYRRAVEYFGRKH
ncbi:NTP transferase domain-containing protein [Anaerobacillus sp. MEB173]|uniref:nucleotidyltransferase family protein n=1 Tax=Anaerobacillus sp. MEB173 TaxID=3383345 RepID=UPI003F924B6F